MAVYDAPCIWRVIKYGVLPEYDAQRLTDLLLERKQGQPHNARAYHEDLTSCKTLLSCKRR